MRPARRRNRISAELGRMIYSCYDRSMSDKHSVLPLAALALGWGLSKGYLYGKRIGSGTVRREAFDPRRFVTHSLVGPIIEEVTIRKQLQPHIGLWPTAMIFGALHFNPKHGYIPEIVAKVADATLGGLLYGIAFEEGGLTSSSTCHVLHNLGTNLGMIASCKR